MITFSLEPFNQVYREMYPLLEEHYREISTHVQHGIALDPQVHIYQQRERDGQLMMFIGREAGKIRAYLVAFIGPGLHYSACLTTIVDIFYVEKSARGLAHGVAMFRAAIAESKRRGSILFRAGSKCAHDASPILRRVGMEPVEVIHEIWLKD